MTLRSEFYSAVLTPEADVPRGLTDGQDGPAGKRFDVYRNNVAVSLTEALETAFPVIRRLVGEENFKLLAGAFLRKHPPSSPLLMLYGADLATFLESFPPTASLGYLPDVARLEQAMRESYHAEDAEPVDASALAAVPEDKLTDTHLALAPSLKVLRSRWPIHSIWAYNTQDGAPKPAMKAEDVAIFRAEYDPEPVLLKHGEAAFIGALQSGESLGQAMDQAAQVTDRFDLPGALTQLLTRQSIVKIGA